MTVTSKHPDTLVNVARELASELRIVDMHIIKLVTDIQTTDNERTWKITYKSEETMEKILHKLKSRVEEDQTRLKPKPCWQLGSLKISGLFLDTQAELDKHNLRIPSNYTSTIQEPII